ncbi:alpha/beta hydrolase [Sphingobium aquiterrae]|uniref:alpha/beta fold hydrolase n=1 Tax=Sphingobium aquiterrae TaxID=2038656 RepID=UPI003018F058
MTDAPPPRFLARPDGLRLAYRFTPGDGPTIVFLPGYMSDMAGSKATALFDWAVARARACLLLDYAGNGASEGAFVDGTLTSWRDDALFLIDSVTQGPLVVVGSSMGGWIALLVAIARAERMAGLVGIAAAPDFTDWGFTDAQKARLRADGRIEEPSDYGDQPYVTTLAFWESGQASLLLGTAMPIDCPVRLLQGQQDADVPWETALGIAAAVRSSDVQTLLIKDGDHRLSRDADIARLIATVAALVQPPEPA